MRDRSGLALLGLSALLAGGCGQPAPVPTGDTIVINGVTYLRNGAPAPVPGAPIATTPGMVPGMPAAPVPGYAPPVGAPPVTTPQPYPQPGYPQPGYPQPGNPQPGYGQPGYPAPTAGAGTRLQGGTWRPVVQTGKCADSIVFGPATMTLTPPATANVEPMTPPVTYADTTDTVTVTFQGGQLVARFIDPNTIQTQNCQFRRG